MPTPVRKMAWMFAASGRRQSLRPHVAGWREHLLSAREYGSARFVIHSAVHLSRCTDSVLQPDPTCDIAMPSLHFFLLYISASLVLNLTPGPDMALTLTRGMTQGFKAAWLSVLGTFAAGLIQIPLVVFGLAGIFRESPVLFDLLKIAGALYLFYLGLRALRRSIRGTEAIGAANPEGDRGVFWQGLFTNLLNPKVFIFLVAFLPQFVDPDIGPIWQQMLVLAVSSKILGLLNGTCFAYGASRIRVWLSRNLWFLRLQDSLLGVAMLGIAGYLVFNRAPGGRG